MKRAHKAGYDFPFLNLHLNYGNPANVTLNQKFTPAHSLNLQPNENHLHPQARDSKDESGEATCLLQLARPLLFQPLVRLTVKGFVISRIQ